PEADATGGGLTHLRTSRGPRRSLRAVLADRGDRRARGGRGDGGAGHPERRGPGPLRDRDGTLPHPLHAGLPVEQLHREPSSSGRPASADYLPLAALSSDSASISSSRLMVRQSGTSALTAIASSSAWASAASSSALIPTGFGSSSRCPVEAELVEIVALAPSWEMSIGDSDSSFTDEVASATSLRSFQRIRSAVRA